MKSKIKVPTRLSSLLRAQLLLVLLFLMGSGTAFAQLGATLTATVIKDASPCECDGVVELTLSGCTVPLNGIWSIFVSNENPLLCNLGPVTWNDDDFRYLSYRMGEPPDFMHLEERAPVGTYRIEGLCGGTWYFRVGLSTTRDFQGRFLMNYVGDASTNNVEAVTVELQGNTAPPLLCDVQITDCGSCYYQTVSYTAMGGTPPLRQIVRGKSDGLLYPMDRPLPRGTYEYIVTDANGCECTKEFTITTDKPLPPVSLKVTPIGCNGDDGGCVEIVGDAGGLPIYWDKINTDGSVVELDEHNGKTKVCGWQTGDRGVVSIVDRTCVLEFPWSMTAVEPISAALLTKRVVEGNQCYAILDVVNITGGTPGYTIQWDNEAPVPAPGTKKVLLPAAVTFTVRDANGCEYSEGHNLTCGRILVTIYPNPVGDQATAAFHADKLALYNYELFNVSFGLVGGATLGSLMPGDHTFNVNMSTLPSGVYYLLLYEDGIPNSVYVQIVK